MKLDKEKPASKYCEKHDYAYYSHLDTCPECRKEIENETRR